MNLTIRGEKMKTKELLETLKENMIDLVQEYAGDIIGRIKYDIEDEELTYSDVIGLLDQCHDDFVLKEGMDMRIFSKDVENMLKEELETYQKNF